MLDHTILEVVSTVLLQDSSRFEILRGSIFRIDLVIRPKSGQNSIFGPKLGSKPQNCPKSISHEPLVVESWLTPQNDWKTWFTIGILKYVYLSGSRKCPKKSFFCFYFVLYDEMSKVLISWELYIILNWLTIQNDQKAHLSISV